MGTGGSSQPELWCPQLILWWLRRRSLSVNTRLILSKLWSPKTWLMGPTRISGQRSNFSSLSLFDIQFENKLIYDFCLFAASLLLILIRIQVCNTYGKQVNGKTIWAAEIRISHNAERKSSSIWTEVCSKIWRFFSWMTHKKCELLVHDVSQTLAHTKNYCVESKRTRLERAEKFYEFFRSKYGARIIHVRPILMTSNK